MSGPAARIQAQAKLNLYLRVLNREESGYHSIETIYHRIDLADEIAVHAEDDRLRAIDVQGADAARGRAYYTVYSDVGPDHTGRYLDRYVRVGDEWLFSRRRVTTDWFSPESFGKPINR